MEGKAENVCKSLILKPWPNGLASGRKRAYKGEGEREEKEWREGTPAVKAASYASPPTVLR